MEEIPLRSKASPRHFSKKWRGIVLSALGLLLVTGVMVALPHPKTIQAANTVTAGDWPMYMHDVGRSSNNSTETIINQSSAPQLKQHWAYSEGAAIFSQPVVAGGLIYWGSFDGYEHATNLSGQQVWSQKLGGTVTTCAPVKPFGIVSSAAVVNGVVYVGSWDHNVYGLDAKTGTKLWSYPTGSAIDSSPAVAHGVVYIGSHDGNVYGLDAKTGTKLWSYPTGSAIDASSPAVAHGVVYIGSDGRNVYAFHLPGTQP